MTSDRPESRREKTEEEYSSASAGGLSEHSEKEFKSSMKSRKMLAKLKLQHK